MGLLKVFGMQVPAEGRTVGSDKGVMATGEAGQWCGRHNKKGIEVVHSNNISSRSLEL
jgi:hypothetical protein